MPSALTICSLARLTCGLLLVVLLQACQSLEVDPLDSPRFVIPVNSTLHLHQPLTIPAEQVSLWLQDGNIMAWKDLNFYQPHCKFETWTLLPRARVIEPDTFTIHRVTRWEDYAGRPLQLAARPVRSGFAMDGDGYIRPQNRATLLFLRSSRQADVYRLTCSQWQEPFDAQYLTVNQMRQALGDVFSLHLASNPGVTPT